MKRRLSQSQIVARMSPSEFDEFVKWKERNAEQAHSVSIDVRALLAGVRPPSTPPTPNFKRRI
jgi:hypothetical protein